MKKALSLLLAVLMLVSLFGTMAFADDDVVEEVVAEEPVAEEPVAEEPAPVDEVVGDGAEEAAAAVEEYTDEGSFDAAEAVTMSNLDYWMDATTGIDPYKTYEIEYTVPEKPTCGQSVEVHFRDKTTKVAIAKPTTVLWDHVFGAFDPTDPAAKEVGWVTISSKDATCTEEGNLHQQRACTRSGCKYKEERDVTLARLAHVWGTDPFGADPDPRSVSMEVTTNAILVMPTATEKGLGHEACIYCGGLNPDTKDYPIPVHKETDPHKGLWGPWYEKVAPTCLTEGFEERICIVPGCTRSQDRKIDPLADPLGKDAHNINNKKGTMAFDHLERLDCAHYAEVWVCTNPNCHSKWDKKAGQWVHSDTASQYEVYVGKGGTEYKTLDELKNTPANGYEYTDTSAKHNTEFYLHHRYTDDWQIAWEARCCRDGLKYRECSEGAKCPDLADSRMTYPIPALEPIYGDTVYTAYDSANAHWYHYRSCTRDECVAWEYLEPVFPALDENLQPIVADPDDPSYYTQKNNFNKQALVVDHTWGEWKVEVPMTETQRGHLFRTCTVVGCGEREDFFGTQAEFDAKYNPPTPPHPVLKAGLVWEVEDNQPVCKLYEMGVVKTDFTGIYEETDGKKYFVDKGIMCSDANGLAEFGGTWYFLAKGCIQEQYSGLALYDGEWFYLENGKLDLGTNGLVDYDGSKFLVGVGRIQYEYTGLYLEDNVWYFIGSGQVATYYTGIVEYDGEMFYVEKGVLVPYNGQAEYNGVVYNVVNGQVA